MHFISFKNKDKGKRKVIFHTIRLTIVGGIFCASFLSCDNEDNFIENTVVDPSEEEEKPDTEIVDLSDTLKVYFYSILLNPRSENYILAVDCPKGTNYEDYWLYIPKEEDAGETQMHLGIYNFEGKLLDEKYVTLITRKAENPKTPQNILCIGNSLMVFGQTPIELSRRLKGTIGIPNSPASLDLDNYYLVGRLKNADGTVGWEGTGGYTWDRYKDFNVENYIQTYCNGKLDYVYLQLGINELLAIEPFDDLEWILNGAKRVINRFHEAYPNCHILLGSVLLPSQNGGLGSYYPDGSINSMYGALGFGVKVHRLNVAYQDLANSEEYKEFTHFIDNNAQFDCLNVYPTTNRPVGNYEPGQEEVETNSVHPTDIGYWQIAAGIFRALIGLAS